MTIEPLLLILESVLLLATIILLLYSIREGRGRKNLLLEVGKATKILLSVIPAVLKPESIFVFSGFPLNRLRE
jgi:hypothetical protein